MTKPSIRGSLTFTNRTIKNRILNRDPIIAGKDYTRLKEGVGPINYSALIRGIGFRGVRTLVESAGGPDRIIELMHLMGAEQIGNVLNKERDPKNYYAVLKSVARQMAKKK